MNWHALRLSLKHANPLQVLARYIYQGVRRCIVLDIFHMMYLVADSPNASTSSDSKLEFDFVPADVVRRAATDPNSGMALDAVESALSRHEECFGACTSEQLVSYLWLAPSGAHLCQDVYVYFSTQYAYSRWSYTRNEYRGQHLHSITKNQALTRLSQRGTSGILSMVDVGNLPSVRAARHSGCRRVGILIISRIGKRRIIWASSGCRAYNVKLERIH